MSITPTVERDFARRGVFSELRLENAVKKMNGGTTGVYEVSVEKARELLADAEERRRDRTTPRNSPQAFTALAKHLRHALRRGQSDCEENAQGRMREADREALKRSAELDAAAQKIDEWVRDLPATEEAFRAYAHESFWRLWSSFEVIFLRQDSLLRKSGFRFTATTVEVLKGYVMSILWALDDDGEVVFDEEVRLATVRAAQLAAARADAPMQRLVEAVRDKEGRNAG